MRHIYYPTRTTDLHWLACHAQDVGWLPSNRAETCAEMCVKVESHESNTLFVTSCRTITNTGPQTSKTAKTAISPQAQSQTATPRSRPPSARWALATASRCIASARPYYIPLATQPRPKYHGRCCRNSAQRNRGRSSSSHVFLFATALARTHGFFGQQIKFNLPSILNSPWTQSPSS